MELNNSPHNKRKQRTREDIIQLLRDYQNSDGISIEQYCENIGVSDATFYNWRKKYREWQEPPVDFVPLEITGSHQPAASLQAEVKVIKFYGPLCIEQLKTLLS